MKAGGEKEESKGEEIRRRRDHRCDLCLLYREEVRSSDFFWNRMAFIYCLQQVCLCIILLLLTLSLQSIDSFHWQGCRLC